MRAVSSVVEVSPPCEAGSVGEPEDSAPNEKDGLGAACPSEAVVADGGAVLPNENEGVLVAVDSFALTSLEVASFGLVVKPDADATVFSGTAGPAGAAGANGEAAVAVAFVASPVFGGVPKKKDEGDDEDGGNPEDCDAAAG